MTTVALVDDHKIFSDSLAGLINDFEGFEVIWTALDGKEAIQYITQKGNRPDILLLDIIMPGMNGIDFARWIYEHERGVKVLALTMEEDDDNVIQMLQYSVKGYLLKSIGAEELLTALQHVVKYGYYYTPIITGNIHRQIEKKVHQVNVPDLTDREMELLKHLGSDLSYAAISKKMFLSESTIDTYRARLFEKFEVKNRIGLLVKAVHMGLVKL